MLIWTLERVLEQGLDRGPAAEVGARFAPGKAGRIHCSFRHIGCLVSAMTKQGRLVVPTSQHQARALLARRWVSRWGRTLESLLDARAQECPLPLGAVSFPLRERQAQESRNSEVSSDALSGSAIAVVSGSICATPSPASPAHFSIPARSFPGGGRGQGQAHRDPPNKPCKGPVQMARGDQGTTLIETRIRKRLVHVCRLDNKQNDQKLVDTYT